MLQKPSVFLLNLWIRDNGPDEGSFSWSVIWTFISKHIVCFNSLDRDSNQFWTNFINISGIQIFIEHFCELRTEKTKCYKKKEY